LGEGRGEGLPCQLKLAKKLILESPRLMEKNL
jgi:hypothetical protein